MRANRCDYAKLKVHFDIKHIAYDGKKFNVDSPPRCHHIMVIF